MVSTAVSFLVVGVAFAAFDASAATIRVQCEQRGVQRARISVDGNNLVPLPAGQMYRAQVVLVSGLGSATSVGEPLVGDEVGFDFDSNPGDIAAGATAIPRNFIDGNVTGKILAPDGSTVISDTVACRVR
jgi:hypothetical protein